MFKHYPSQQDLKDAAKVERVVRDIYDRLYKVEKGNGASPAPQTRTSNVPGAPSAQTISALRSSGVSSVSSAPKQINSGTYAARPTATAYEPDTVYFATDQNVLYIVEAGAWTWLGGVMEGTIAPDERPTLAAEDIGFLFYGTDTNRIYHWNSAAWVILSNHASLDNLSYATAGHTGFLENADQAVGTRIVTAADKTPPIDADVLALSDSAASNTLKKLSWANVKATLKTYFDTLYEVVGAVATHVGLADPHTQYQKESEKDAASGYVGLDASSNASLAGTTLRIQTAKTPSSASDTGNAGDICWDASYIYVCVATDTWKRTAISTWP